MSADPVIELFGDSTRNMLGIWLAVPDRKELPAAIARLSAIKADFRIRDGKYFLEVGTSSVSLYRQFYHFVVAVAERVTEHGTPPLVAIDTELNSFGDLFAETEFLGAERQIGLLGELLFLERLIKLHGANALDAWLGPAGEPHDFRVESTEFEVKTTVATRRVHTIHGVEQLTPSAGCALVVVSTMLGPAGASSGFSLASKASDLEKALAGQPERANQLLGNLRAAGFHKEDAANYGRLFALRRPLGVVPVDGSFPAIGRPHIQLILGASAPRVDDLRYDVDLEGLQLDDGTPQFGSIIGAQQ